MRERRARRREGGDEQVPWPVCRSSRLSPDEVNPNNVPGVAEGVAVAATLAEETLAMLLLTLATLADETLATLATLADETLATLADETLATLLLTLATLADETLATLAVLKLATLTDERLAANLGLGMYLGFEMYVGGVVEVEAVVARRRRRRVGAAARESREKGEALVRERERRSRRMVDCILGRVGLRREVEEANGRRGGSRMWEKEELQSGDGGD